MSRWLLALGVLLLAASPSGAQSALPLGIAYPVDPVPRSGSDVVYQARRFYSDSNVEVLARLDRAAEILARPDDQVPDVRGELSSDLLSLLGVRATHPAAPGDLAEVRLRLALEPLGEAYRYLLQVDDGDLAEVQRATDIMRPESDALAALKARNTDEFQKAINPWTDLDRLRLAGRERRRLQQQPELVLDTLTLLGSVLRELGERELPDIRTTLAGGIPSWTTPETVALFEEANDNLMGPELELGRRAFLLQVGHPEHFAFLAAASRCYVILHSLLEDEETNRTGTTMRGPWDDPRFRYGAMSPIARAWGDSGWGAVATVREAWLERERAWVLGMRHPLDAALGGGMYRGRRSLLQIPGLEDPTYFQTVLLPELLRRDPATLLGYGDFLDTENATGRDAARFLAAIVSPVDPVEAREKLLDTMRATVEWKREIRAQMLAEESRLLYEEEQRKLREGKP